MRRAASAFLLFALLCSGAQAQHRTKISPDAAAADASSEIKVIIQWKIAVGEQTSSKVTALGGKVLKEFRSLKQGVYQIPASALSTLDSDTDVKYVTVDRTVKRKLAVTTAAINAQAAWSSGYTGTGVGVAVLDSGINPDPNLGVAPTSIVFTDDFTPGAYTTSPTEPGPGPAPLPVKSPSFGADWYGHGQHIAGIIASNGRASTCGKCATPLVGVAPGANLIDLKVLDENGEGTDSQVIAAIDEAIQYKNLYNIRVMNLSLGRPVVESYTQDPLCQAVEAAWQAGIVVVTAAGNEGRDNSANNLGYGTILAPGNDPSVLTVGAMKTMGTVNRADDLVASYSSKGPTAIDHIVKPDVVAPGNLIVSLLAQHGTLPLTNPQNAVTVASIQGGPTPNNAPQGGNVPTNAAQQPPKVNFGPGYSNVYYTLSGTSMATAVVSGAVADLIQAYPALTPDQVKILVMQSSSKTFPTSSTVVDNVGNVYTDYYDMFTIGAGYLDLGAAMNAAATQVPPAGNSLSPSSTYDPTSGNIYVSFDPNSVWANQTVTSNRCMWGASAIWGTSVLAGNTAVWSSRCMWGASADSAERCMWGASSILSSSSDASASTDSGSRCMWGASMMLAGEN